MKAPARIGALIAGAVLILAPLLAADPVYADAADDFPYASWDARYQLSRQEDGRAKLTVTETLVADFPDTDQNHGIVRGLPQWYDGAPLHPRVVSVTDGAGTAVPFDDDTVQDGELKVKVGDPDTYQHGRTTYVIRYTMVDVVHRPTDRAIDEWYWNLLPLNSAQPIARFTGELTFTPEVAAALTGARSCYAGPAYARADCTLAPDPAAPRTFLVTQNDVPAGSGVTVSFAMTEGTFAPAPARIPDPLTDIVPFYAAGGGALIAVGGAIGGIGVLRRRGRRSGRGIVVAQYDVPASLPPLLAATIEGRRGAAIPAEIVHLAVHGAIRIKDGAKKPQLTLRDPSIAPDPLDAAALTALFPAQTRGATVRLDEPDDALVKRLGGVSSRATAAAIDRDLVVRRRSRPAAVLSAIGCTAALAAAGVAVPGMIVGRPAAIASFVVALVLALVAVAALVIALRRYAILTPAGAEAREYLLGVCEYIRLAEADRIRMLQSYRGAQRRADGSADVIVLYERLLPYAMLWGLEREWARVLTVQYEHEDAAPGWYAGYAAGNLAGSLSGMNSSLSATPAPTSSSGSGSYGGGYSGGGGGGGSSGGW